MRLTTAHQVVNLTEAGIQLWSSVSGTKGLIPHRKPSDLFTAPDASFNTKLEQAEFWIKDGNRFYMID